MRRVTHIVLMKPRPDLTDDDRAALLASFEHALRAIPAVRGVRVGRRVRHGANYEATALDTADYLVAIDFDDLDGLRAYLQHPAHEELGARFNRSLASALVYDFEVTGMEGARALAGRPD